MQEVYPIDDRDATKIAIVGMAGRFPGANTIEAFWQNLKNGVESISFFTDEALEANGVDPAVLRDPSYVKAGAVLENIDQFDASFFGYAPREAALMDPQQRLLLECAWEALEQAGYNPDTYGGRIGVYAGGSMSSYLLHNLCSVSELIGPEHLYATMLANDKDFLATRVAYKCNLKGPSLTVQTACSTSLVATHLACQSLLNGETDIALVGGVSVGVPHKTGYLYRASGIFSPDGHCRAFDAAAQGTVAGSGVGVVVLKRLGDALAERDHIYAVILGSAINNDGALKAGYTTPSEEGQAAAIAEALAVANIEPIAVTCIETHGTGTAVGDPIEIAALTQIFGMNGNNKGYCAIGSVKTNIGHLDAAAGIAGLIKVALALKHQIIPPSLHFEHPNPHIDFTNSPFYVNTRLTNWETAHTPRRAGVSSFGIGGTNAHVVLEEPPTRIPSASAASCQLLLLSARTPGALEYATANLAAHLKQHPLDLADVAYTLQVGRKPFTHRRFLVCQDRIDAISVLEAQDPERLITRGWKSRGQSAVFMFPGQGTQYVNMARDLYHNVPIFREHLTTCATHIKRVAGLNLHELLYPINGNVEDATQTLNQTAISQLALFAVEYAMAQLWIAWGVRPQAMIGHSIGEYAAACLAGVFSLEDALTLIAARSRLMQAQPGGSMLAVPLSEHDVQPLLGQHLSLAAINGPAMCVVSGPGDAIACLESQLTQSGITCQRLHTSHAFHSQMMEPAMEPFMRQVKMITLNPPRIPYLSNVSGSWITADEATDPVYWSRHLRTTVRFSQGIEELLSQDSSLFLEVGPGRTLTTLVKRHPLVKADQVIVSSLRHPHDQVADDMFALGTLGKLWLSGMSIDWERLHAPAQRARVPLPTYPFERQRYWIEPRHRREQPLHSDVITLAEEVADIAPQTLYPRPHLQGDYVAPRNQIEATLVQLLERLLGIEQIGIYDNFFDLGGDSFLAVQLVNQLHNHFQAGIFLHHIIEAPTVARLAMLLQTLAERAQQGLETYHSPLVALKPNGNRRPLFCVHPAGGTVLCYLDLARHLDPDQPLYGLQAPSMYGGPHHETIEEAASCYLDVVRGVQPHGPYLLSGMSYGGNVAFEMARQLHQQGEETNLLALFDSYPPVAYHNLMPDPTEFLVAFPWIFGMFLGPRQSPPFTYEDLRRRDPQEQLAYVFERITEARLFPLNMAQQELGQFFEVWKAHHHALRYYDPPHQAYPNTITLFRAAEELPSELLSLLKIDLSGQIAIAGWKMLTSSPLQVCEVPGNHITMLVEPHVQILAKHLNACLTRLEEGSTQHER